MLFDLFKKKEEIGNQVEIDGFFKSLGDSTSPQRFDKAAEAFRGGLRLAPDNVASYGNLVNSLLGLQRFDEVRQIIQGMRGNFTLRDVEASLKKTNPNRTIRLPSLSTILLRLSSDSVIKTITPGVGRQATVYSKPEPLARAS